MNILGVRIDNLSYSEVLEKIESFLGDGNFHQVATVNPEFILEAQKDEEFKNILNGCDLNIADGVGIKFAFWRFGKLLKTRIAGADLMDKILEMADAKKISVFLAVNKNGLSLYEDVKNALSLRYPNVQFFGEDIDSKELNYKLEANEANIYKLVLCNFGAPYQEKFINSLKDGKPPHLYAKLQNNMPLGKKNALNNENLSLQHQRCGGKIGVAMGVGGSFDYVTGKTKRAPKIMRIFGLEWLWRLILEPKYRFKRVFNAVVIFPIKVIFNFKK